MFTFMFHEDMMRIALIRPTNAPHRERSKIGEIGDSRKHKYLL